MSAATASPPGSNRTATALPACACGAVAAPFGGRSSTGSDRVPVARANCSSLTLVRAIHNSVITATAA